MIALVMPPAGANPDNVRIEQYGNSAWHLAAKLQRDHPDMAKRLAAGEFKAVRAATRVGDDGVVSSLIVVRHSARGARETIRRARGATIKARYE